MNSPGNLLPQLEVLPNIERVVLKTRYPEWRWLDGREEICQ